MADIILGISVVSFQALAAYAGFHVSIAPPKDSDPNYGRKLSRWRWSFGLLTLIALALGCVVAWRSVQSVEEMRNQMTGGDSFGFVFPAMPKSTNLLQTQYTLIVTNQGRRYPLHGVNLQVTQQGPDQKWYMRDISVGDIAPMGLRFTSLEDAIQR